MSMPRIRFWQRCRIHWISILILLLSSLTITLIQAKLDPTELSRLKIRELKSMLQKKGKDAECIACPQKSDLVARVLETMDWPDVEPEVVEKKERGEGNDSDEQMRKLKEDLEKQGIDTSKMFFKAGADDDKLKEVLRDWEENEKKKKKGMGGDAGESKESGGVDGNDGQDGNPKADEL